MASRIAVLGAGGFIGRHVCARLGAAGFDVTAAIRGGEEDIAGSRRTISLPYDDPAHFDELLCGCDWLVHAAPGGLDPLLVPAWEEAPDDAGRLRVVIDQIASMTEGRLERTDRQNSGAQAHMG